MEAKNNPSRDEAVKLDFLKEISTAPFFCLANTGSDDWINTKT